MKKLDWYIIRKYLTTFFFAMLLISMVAVVENYAENVDKFLASGLPLQDILSEYYLNFIPWINGLLWPLFALISVIFFTSRMAKNSEIIAMLSSGISTYRLLVPYLIAGSIIALMLWYGNNYIIPNSNKHKNAFEQEYLKKRRTKTRSYDVHFFVEPKTKIFVKFYRKRDSTAQNFRMETFDEELGLREVLQANKMIFKEAPNRWTLKDYRIRKFDGINEELLHAQGEQKDTTINITPNDFEIHTKQMEIMSSRDLREFIDREETRGLDNTKKYYIELYRRNADPFTIIILTIIGFAVASRKDRGGMGLHLASGMIIGAAFVVFSKFAVTFATNLSISPLLGIWSPNIIFFCIAVYLLMRAKK